MVCPASTGRCWPATGSRPEYAPKLASPRRVKTVRPRGECSRLSSVGQPGRLRCVGGSPGTSAVRPPSPEGGAQHLGTPWAHDVRREPVTEPVTTVSTVRDRPVLAGHDKIARSMLRRRSVQFGWLAMARSNRRQVFGTGLWALEDIAFVGLLPYFRRLRRTRAGGASRSGRGAARADR